MVTAAAVHAYAMRTRTAPHLRALGFKGSGQRYALPHEKAWAQLGFQKSRGNTARSMRFTVNLSVIGKEAWERAHAEASWLPERPNPNVRYGARGETVRIGLLLPSRSDVWWGFEAGEGPVEELAEPCATDVCTVITDHMPCPICTALWRLSRSHGGGRPGATACSMDGTDGDGPPEAGLRAGRPSSVTGSHRAGLRGSAHLP
ncbi:DUF4304 domain-containing protein [Streptomyces thermoalcalitolerans]|uniref:DUF4304 domain-containing protein n=1 Tax=Streptomyces thermoalcalitolerans TaxID=65605 RepID=A0ABN1NNZ5_9ACTN